MSDLQKLFVLVPDNSSATVEAIKTTSLSSNKVYFMAKYNQIVAKGAVYGVDPSTGNELKTLVSVLGGTKGPDGTVTVDFSHLNYYTSEGTKTIIGAIEAIDAKVKAEMDKLAASKTLGENYEFTGQIKYVAAKDGVAAHIALVDEAGAELSTIPVSDIIGNGVLKTSAYDAATGILTLTFAQADGTEKGIEVDLKAMLDINDISIAEASKNYLEVSLGSADTEGNTQAVFGAKIVKVAEATDAKTGLVDAKDVKDYVDGKATDLAVTAEGDDYVSASVNAGVDKKHVIVASNVANIVYTPASGSNAAKLEGSAYTLVDGAQAATAIKGYVDAVVAKEAADRSAYIVSKIEGLDVPAIEKGGNVKVKISETDGKVALESVTEDYATVNYTAHSDSKNTSISVAKGDEAKLIKASDLANVAGYAAGKVTEEAARVDAKIAGLRGSATSDAVAGVTTTVTTSGGEVSTVSMIIADNAVTVGGSKNARTLTPASTTGVLKGDAIASITAYVAYVVADNSANLSVEAAGDEYITAGVDKDNNKKINVSANVGTLSYVTSDGKSTLSGVDNKLAYTGDVADKVSSFVNARIGEEIGALGGDKTGTGNGISTKVTTTAGEVSSVVISVADNTVNASDLSVAAEDGVLKGNAVASIKTYVDNAVTNKNVAAEGDKKFIAAAAANNKVTVTGTYAVLNDNNTSVKTDGIATGTFVHDLVGRALDDLWETYTEVQAPQA